MANAFQIIGQLDLLGDGLEAHILDFTRAVGITIKEGTRTVFRGMLRDLFDYIPPGSQKAHGKDAQRAGEKAIKRDLNRMGFTEVKIKGFRMISHVPGGSRKGARAVPITPVRVKTKLNPAFADPDAFHKQRLLNKHGGKVSRGGGRGFYAAANKFRDMRTRLFGEVGTVAAVFVRAAQQLDVTVPAWIKRHAANVPGNAVQIVEQRDRFIMRVVNQMPEGDHVGEETQRRIETFIIPAAIGRLERQLRAKFAGLWDKTKK